MALQIDTPGGLDSSTRLIIKSILESPVPVAAWVAPGGARAASAGAYILYASHIAATPVQIRGLPGSPAPAAPEPKASETKATAPASGVEGDAMSRKIVNDSAAYLRSLAQMRGRNGDWADRAVREGVSLSAQEAQSQKVIDFIAVDLAGLLQQAHGRTVQMSGGVRHTVDSRDRSTITVESDWRTRVLGVLTDPTVAFLLLLIGIYGLYFELTSPGFGVPGFGISRGLIALVAVINVLFVWVTFRLALKARTPPVVSGAEELPGATGEILAVSSGSVTMRVHGERMNAVWCSCLGGSGKSKARV